MNRNILYAGAAIATYFIIKGGNSIYSASRLQFLIAKIGFKLEGITPYLILDVMAQNPTGSSFDLSSLIGQVFVNNSLVGNASYFTPTTITENSQTKIIIPVRVALLGAAAEIISILTGAKKAAANLRITGTVNVNYVPAPIDLIFSIV